MLLNCPSSDVCRKCQKSKRAYHFPTHLPYPSAVSRTTTKMSTPFTALSGYHGYSHREGCAKGHVRGPLCPTTPLFGAAPQKRPFVGRIFYQQALNAPRRPSHIGFPFVNEKYPIRGRRGVSGYLAMVSGFVAGKKVDANVRNGIS